VKAEAGESVRMTMELDTAPLDVEVPDDLAAGLGEDEQARSVFESLSYSHKKEYITWIEDAKKAETRQNRIVKSIEKLKAGKRLK
ncbi:YdeI/OmpD-associated family protein, partial [Paenibacillus sp. MCAF20]